MKSMPKLNQVGTANATLISLFVVTVLLIGALVFGGWAFNSREDYKNHTDAKVTKAVAVAKQQESSRKDVEFKEKEKQPLRTYDGPDAYGGIALQYPKTWSGYVDESGGSSAKIDGYFYSGIVPSISDKNSVFALRIQVLAQPYDQVASRVDKLQQSAEKQGTPITVDPYSLPRVSDVVGIKLSGPLPGTNEKQGTMVILPLRSQTLELWTESSDFEADFNNNILPNFTFSP
jgi:hypothetical protein